LATELDKLEQEGTTAETISSIMNIESALDEYCPQSLTKIEKALDVSQLKEAVELIEKAKKLMNIED